MTVKELLDMVGDTTNITFSTDNDILDKQLYEYPYLRLKSILDRGIRKFEVRWLEHLMSKLLSKNEQLEKKNEELKAQITQWHDLRKDPNDLPKEKTMYRVIYDNPMINRPAVWYLPSLKRWEYSDLPIIAWCELPKFEG